MNFKIILAGDPMVGKTTLIKQFIHRAFKEEYKPTIGVDIFTKQLTDKNDVINLQIWDIAGQTSFQKFRERFFAKARGALIVYDVTNPKSLDSLRVSWIRDLELYSGAIPMILIGNKIDLKESIKVLPNEAQKLLDQYSTLSTHIRTSALTGENVEAAFQELVDQILIAIRKKKILH